MSRKLIYKTFFAFSFLVSFSFAPQFSPEAKAWEVYSEYYGGDNTDGSLRAHGLSNAPDICMVGDEGTEDVVFRTSDMVGDVSLSWRQNSVLESNMIQALNATSVELGDSSHVNLGGVSYMIVCIMCEGDGDCETLDYTGNGSDNREIAFGSITDVRWIGIKNASATDPGSHRFASVTSTEDFSLTFHEFSNNPVDEIQKLGTSTFELGTQHVVNASGEHYFGFALGTNDGLCEDKYFGDDIDDRNILCGIDPEVVFLQTKDDIPPGGAPTRDEPHFLVDGYTDAAFSFSFNSEISNSIQSTTIATADGFQVGNSTTTNRLGFWYHFWGIMDTPELASPSSRRRDPPPIIQ